MTSINQNTRVTEIHEPDGKNDLLQQVENGALSVVNSYLSLGRLYRGIICNNLRQYVLLGDAAAMTDGKKGNADDRWIFTENNPVREMLTAAQLAAISRVMKGFNDTLSVHCLNIAKEIFEAQNKEKEANRGFPIGNNGLRPESRRLVVYPRRSGIRHGTHPSRFPRTVGIPIPLATNGILLRRSLLSLHVYSIGCPASMELKIDTRRESQIIT